MNKRNWNPIAALLLVGCCAFLAYAHVIVINTTPSMPQGIYVRQWPHLIHRGDTVAACLTQHVQASGLKRHYLKMGMPCHGAALLVKSVLALPGDRVTLQKHRIIVNGVSFPYATLDYDAKQRPLNIVPRGTYISHGYWLIGNASQLSWDSRYWGEIAGSQIKAQLTSLLTW